MHFSGSNRINERTIHAWQHFMESKQIWGKNQINSQRIIPIYSHNDYKIHNHKQRDIWLQYGFQWAYSICAQFSPDHWRKWMFISCFLTEFRLWHGAQCTKLFGIKTEFHRIGIGTLRRSSQQDVLNSESFWKYSSFNAFLSLNRFEFRFHFQKFNSCSQSFLCIQFVWSMKKSNQNGNGIVGLLQH